MMRGLEANETLSKLHHKKRITKLINAEAGMDQQAMVTIQKHKHQRIIQTHAEIHR